MSLETATLASQRILDHCQTHGKTDAAIIFHGGEPLIGGLDHLRMLVGAIRDVFANSQITPNIGMQSNGLLFTPEIGDFMLENGLSMGISIDGPPEVNDRYRLDLLGRPSSTLLEQILNLLTSDPYRKVFSGFLVVVDPSTDPIQIYEYLRQFRPSGIDYILPYDNYDRRPAGKQDFEATPYADWMIRLFDHWYESNSPIPIREFESILRSFFGGRTLVESIGVGPVDLVVIETNGDIEAVDSLKGTFDGATVLGCNVRDHDFDTVCRHAAIKARQIGIQALCADCRQCEVVHFCGGGYLPNRYSRHNGFDNPSIYCRDLEQLIRHVYRRATSDLRAQGMMV
jgi:uncharacterized protein